jgi:hypothetical protein
MVLRQQTDAVKGAGPIGGAASLRRVVRKPAIFTRRPDLLVRRGAVAVVPRAAR